MKSVPMRQIHMIPFGWGLDETFQRETSFAKNYSVQSTKKGVIKTFYRFDFESKKN